MIMTTCKITNCLVVNQLDRRDRWNIQTGEKIMNGVNVLMVNREDYKYKCNDLTAQGTCTINFAHKLAS